MCGGPLVDFARPITGPALYDDAAGVRHAAYLRQEIERRSRVIQREACLLAAAFAEGCAVRHVERMAMYVELYKLWREVGPVRVQARESTAPATGLPQIPGLRAMS